MKNDIPPAVKTILNRLRADGHDYIMQWTGSKIPRGATIDGAPIAWSQRGFLYKKGGEQLGYYDRMEEFGGPNRDQHMMLITTDKPAIVVAPDGTVCDASNHPD